MDIEDYAYLILGELEAAQLAQPLPSQPKVARLDDHAATADDKDKDRDKGKGKAKGKKPCWGWQDGIWGKLELLARPFGSWSLLGVRIGSSLEAAVPVARARGEGFWWRSSWFWEGQRWSRPRCQCWAKFVVYFLYGGDCGREAWRRSHQGSLSEKVVVKIVGRKRRCQRLRRRLLLRMPDLRASGGIVEDASARTEFFEEATKALKSLGTFGGGGRALIDSGATTSHEDGSWGRSTRIAVAHGAVSRGGNDPSISCPVGLFSPPR